MNDLQHSRHQDAFTLLEVMLALALTAVIITLIGGAIDMHLRQLSSRRAGIEEAQLARAILRRIADDLRAVVVNRPADFGSFDPLGEGEGETAPAAGGSGSGGGSSGATETESSAADELAATGVLPDELGIYGNLYELNIDISRLPRYEEYDLLLEMGDYTAAGSLGDIKTVSYFFLGAPTSGSYGSSALNSSLNSYRSTSYGASSASAYGTSRYGSSASGTANRAASGFYGQNRDAMQANTGLARRVMDRASIRFAQQNADLGWLDQQTELFAPEVIALEFAYFDGVEWLLEWDTQQEGGLPWAVEIVLVLRADDARLPATSLLTGAGINYDEVGTNHVYRMVVSLPMVDPNAEQSTSEDQAQTEDGS